MNEDEGPITINLQEIDENNDILTYTIEKQPDHGLPNLNGNKIENICQMKIILVLIQLITMLMIEK